MWGIVFIESAERKIPINYAKRVIKNRVYGGQSSFLPLKVNVSGVIPLIFASSLLAFPSSLTAFVSTPWVQSFGQQLVPGRLLYNFVFSILIFFFCFFYVAIQFNPLKISEDLKQGGGFIPGVRPGQSLPFFFGGTALLIVVSVALDTAKQVETFLIYQNYDGFIKKSRKRKLIWKIQNYIIDDQELIAVQKIEPKVC